MVSNDKTMLGGMNDREKVRKQTMKMRRELNRIAILELLPNGII